MAQPFRIRKLFRFPEFGDFFNIRISCFIERKMPKVGHRPQPQKITDSIVSSWI